VRVRPAWSSLLVAVAAAFWIAYVGRLAIARQDNLQTNAFDLGYVSQALWYDAHLEPFRFTTVQGSNAVIEGVDLSKIKHPHWLLAFHVEPALLALAPLYRLWADPRLLLWLQTVALALGALPAAWLARGLTGSRLAGLVFGLAYLLAPGLEGAALSDFHMVAIGAALLMFGLWLLESGRLRWAIACLAAAALTREDAAATVAWLGVVVLLRGHARLAPVALSIERRVPPRGAGAASLDALAKMHRHQSEAATGDSSLDAQNDKQAFYPAGQLVGSWHALHKGTLLSLTIASGVWALLCFGIIVPFFSGGASAFILRYGWLKGAALGLMHGDPGVVLSWLGDVRGYLALQLLTGGIVALLAPLQLLAALPLLAINGLSGFDWMRSGGGHYSALLAPLLLWAGIHGVRRCKAWFGQAGVVAAAALVLVSAVAGQVWAGVSPLRSQVQGDPRASVVLAGLAAIPGQAPVSATSALYPHLSERHDAYWFPAVQGADWVALDAAGDTHPLSPAGAHERAVRLLSRPGEDVVTADDGLLVTHATSRDRDGLLSGDSAERSLGEVLRHDPSALPASFYSFASAGAMLPASASALGPVQFGGQLELAGYELRQWPEVGLLGNSASLVTYWRPLQPMTGQLHFGLATTRPSDGALSGLRDDAAAAPLWWPTDRWQPGQLIRMDMTVDQLHQVQALGVLVYDDAGRRLPASAPAGIPLWDGRTIAQVVRIS
jgi:uncharacterized membrane protein